jgi:predicted lactoylglutathione lyase
MIINESVFAMFLTKGFFRNFTNKEITDAFNSTEVILTINKEIKSEVDEMVNKAISLGAKEVISKQDFGFIYSRCFQDLDGHIWEVNWTNGEIFN